MKERKPFQGDKWDEEEEESAEDWRAGESAEMKATKNATRERHWRCMRDSPKVVDSACSWPWEEGHCMQ